MSKNVFNSFSYFSDFGSNSFFRNGWLASTRLNYGIIFMAILGIFGSFSLNLDKFFSLNYNSFFTGLNVSLSSIIIVFIASLFVFKSNLKMMIFYWFLLAQGIILSFINEVSVSQYWHLIYTWSVLVCWIFISLEIAKSSISRNFKSFGGIFLISYFCVDYLNFLLPVPILFLIVSWFWLKSSKALNTVFYLLSAYLILNLGLAIFQVTTGNFVGLSWLGENSQTAALARQTAFLFDQKVTILRAYGLLPHPNNLAMLGIIGLFVSSIFKLNYKSNQSNPSYNFLTKTLNLRFFYKSGYGQSKSIVYFVKIVCLVIIILSVSRLGLFLGLIGVLSILLETKRTKLRNIAETFIFLIKGRRQVIFGLIIVCVISILSLGRFASDGFRLQEFVWWSQVFQNLPNEKILFGSGVGSSAFVIASNLKLEYWANQPAHFGFINLIIEIGLIPLLMILFGILIGIFIRAVSNFLKYKFPKTLEPEQTLSKISLPNSVLKSTMITELGSNPHKIWITSFGHFSSPEREAEVIQTVLKNIQNQDFDQIYLFSENKKTAEKLTDQLKLREYNIRAEQSQDLNQLSIKNQVNIILTDKQTNIQEMFDQMSSYSNFSQKDKQSSLNQIVILSNCDILFSTNFSEQLSRLKPKDFWAITRYEKSSLYLEGRYDKLGNLYSTSQDVWVSYRQNWNFPKDQYLGSVAVDNFLAFQAYTKGLNVSNPSYEVITEHIHTDNQKLWQNKPKQSGWRLFPLSTKLNETPQVEVIFE